jgi:septum formation inhibitor-activating ATPase MinD
MFPSDYRTVSTAMNSGVPLSLAGNSDIATQFDAFTRRLVDTGAEAPGAMANKKGLLGLERIASLW